MINGNNILFDPAKLQGIASRIPSEDFVASCFDKEAVGNATNILVILSTPRSGSTMLCDLLYKNDFCLAHEYFQPYEYMPILSDRWGCLQKGVLDKALYIEKLCRFRTFENGWLGINLHGEHLPYYLLMEKYLSGIKKHFVHLVRNDTIAQAVSFEIARQTGQWSSNFGVHGECHYSYDGILQCLENIQRQTSLIQAYLKSRNLDCQTIFYEDLLQYPDETLRKIPCVSPEDELQTKPELSKQSGRKNLEWVELFSDRYVANSALPVNGSGRNFLSSFGRVFRL